MYKPLLRTGYFWFLILILSGTIVKSQVVINEICPTNISIIQNSNGDYDDWIEIHNAGSSAVNLSGYGLTDDPSKPFQFKFPSYTLGAGQKIIVFASDTNNSLIVHHWEMAIDAETSWRYATGSASIDTNWRNPSFNHNVWQSGNGGIGFGDNDDGKTVPTSVSVMMRKTFNIPDTSQILKAVVMMDYDDGFVAYLNGVEIARANIGTVGQRPLWNELANSSHEAQMYQGNAPDSFYIDPSVFKPLLRPTNNVFAVETHNTPANNNDLSSIPYLFFGMKSSGTTFSAIPSWFNVPDDDFFNAKFKLARSGETVYLVNASGTVIDSKTYPSMESDNSYGRKPDGSSTWCLFSTPTPESANNSSTCYTGYANPPVFSVQGGYYNSPRTITLTQNTPGGVIRYTKNGNIPTSSSPIYTGPFVVSTSTSVRARVFASGYLPSPVVTNTYLISENTRLSSFSITTDSLNLWDYNTGIYVMGPNASSTSPFFGANFWEDWEKPAAVEYYDRNKNLVVKFDSEISIYGNYSRAKPQKSFEIKLSDRFGTGSFDYSIYPDKPSIDKIDNIILRNAGTDWNKVHFRDALMERIMKNTYSGYLATEPSVMFLNGEYWGVYHINENHDQHWMKNNFGLSKSEIDYLIENGSSMDIKFGSDATYWDLYNYATVQNPSSQAYYDFINSRLDLKNYTDYFIAETYYNNGDWIGDWTNNIKIWRPNAPGSKWRYLLYDLDFGLGLSGSVNDNRLSIARNPAAFSYSSELFDAVLKNPTYKRYFINRYADLINTIYLPSNVDAVMKSYRDTMAYDMDFHFAKWGSNASTWNSLINAVTSFANSRPNIVRDQIKNEFNLSGKVVLTLAVNPSGAGRIEISTITPTSYPWSGTYFNGNPVTITAIPNPGYTFSHFRSNVTITSNNPNQSVTYNFTANDVITAYFNGSSSTAKLVVSELNYNADSAYNSGDWIELHNHGTTLLDLSGWKLKDDNDDNYFVFPTGTVIPANGYLVLTEDSVKFKSQFPTVNNRLGDIGFNFSNSGDQVRLYNHADNLFLSFFYQDVSPWPTLADGQGYTCELSSNTANPNNGSSWFAGCIGGSPGKAYSPLLAIPVTITGNTTFCAGGSALLNATYVPGYNYQWKRNNIDIPGATDSTYIATQTGSYTVRITYQGCAIVSSPVSITTVSQQPPPQVTSATRCGAGSLTLTATATDSIFWYDAPSGGNLIHIGDTLVTPVITQTTNYYARNGRTCSSSAVTAIAGIIPEAAAPVASDVTRCGPGIVTLTATDTAAMRWYNAPIGGGLLETGGTFVTNILDHDTTFYVEAGSVCPSPRIEVVVTVNTTPSPEVSDGSRCGSGTVILSSISSAPVTWYTSQYGGSSVGSGFNFTTPVLNQTDTFYAEANSGCPSVRVRGIAIVTTPPSPPTSQDESSCTPASLTLTATATEQVNWYDAPTGGNLLYLGSVFTTPFLTSTTTYYAEAGYLCSSSRIPVQAIISSPAPPPTASDVARCGPGTVTLNASSQELIYWYDAPTAGNLLATSDFYTTPSLTSTTTYYAEAGTFCRSLTRTAVDAIISPIPAAPVASSVSRCGPGSVTLTATSPLQITWYSSPSGGTPLGTGTTFNTPSISTTTTFYLEAGTTCRSARISVQAIIEAAPSAPTVTGASRCGPGTLTLSASSTSQISWFTSPSGGTAIGNGLSFTTPTLSSTTTYYAEPNNGCIGPRSPVQAVINDIPAAPVAPAVSRCGPGTVTLSATSPESIYWYSVSSGGSPVSTTSSYTTPSLSSTTTYYVETGDVCRSNRISVQAVIKSIPSAPTLTSGYNCGSGTVVLSATSSATVNWFSVSSGGSSIGSGLSFTTPSITSTTTFYAEASSSGCTSTRPSVQAVIRNIPSTPNGTDNSRCGTGTITLSATASGTVEWYTAATGGSQVGSGSSFTTPSISSTTTYYAANDDGFCSSTRTPVIATINDVPAAPIANSVSRCGPGSVTLTASSQEQIYWYTVSSGGSPVSTSSAYTTPSLSTSTTYYVETGDICRSARISVQAVIKTIPAAPVLTSGYTCGPGPVVLGATSTSQVTWYNVLTGGSALGTGLTFTTPSLSSNTTYYAEATNSGCTSTRTSVQAVVRTVPSAPVGTDGSRCGTGTVSLSATASGQIEWYSASTGGTSLGSGNNFTTPVISVTTTFYAANDDGFCESTRTPVLATIDAPPAQPTATSVSRCGPGSVTLTASSPLPLYWYTVATGGTPVSTASSYTTPSLSSTTTYYVEAGNDCRSNRVSVQAIIKPIPSAPVLTDGYHCGPGAVLLTAAASSSQVSWFNVSSGGSSLGTGVNFTTPPLSATTTYYAEATLNGCTSIRENVQAIIRSIPAAPVGTDGSRCGTGTVDLSATASGQIEWYAASSGGTALGSGSSFTTPSISTTTTFYAQNNDGFCSSSRTPVIATIDAAPAAPVTSNVSRCGPGSVTINASSPFPVYWYTVSTGGSPVSTSSAYTTPSLSTTTTYYVEAGNDCRSNRVSVQAIIKTIPAPPVLTDGYHCGPGPVVLTAAASSSQVTWFNVATGGTGLGTGTSFTTPSIAATTTFYAEATSNGCTSTRENVQAIIRSFPTPPVGTGASRCGTGTLNLSATASGQIEWFATMIGGISIGSGNSFTTPSISTTTTYYAQNDDGFCNSSRTPVVATIDSAPAPPVTVSVSRCGPGSVTLNATSALPIYWYTVSTGGTPVSTSSAFTTPSLSSTTTYYVETGDSCRSTRISVQAIIKTIPSSPNVSDEDRCGPGSITFNATSSGQVSWYSVSSGGTALGTGLNFNTPSLSATTTFYAEATSNGCTSSRTPVDAIINPVPAAPVGTGNSRCGTGTVSLSATASGSIEWFATATGGNDIGSGTSFTTPSISTTTTFYAENDDGTCKSVRTPVVATVIPKPAPPVGSDVSRCGPGQVTLTATAPDSVYWYDHQTGGSPLHIGTTFITPTLTSNENYYVETGTTCMSDRVKIKALIVTTPDPPVLFDTSRCGSGVLTIRGVSADQINWFDVPAGGTSIAIGPLFTTPSLNTTTTYYAEVGLGCNSIRVPVQAQINAIPPAPTTADSIRCTPGVLTLSAVSSEDISWYDAATGGSLLGTGSLFTTPSLNSTTSYYVEAGDVCRSNRVEVKAIIGGSQVASVTNGSSCGPGVITLSAVAPAPTDTLKWLNQPNGSVLGTGPTFVTPFLTTSQTYYVVAVSHCTGAPFAVHADIYPVPTVNIGPDTITIQSWQSANLDAGPGFDSYLWSTTETTSSIQVTSEGVYSVVVTDDNGCTATDEVFVRIVVSVNPIYKDVVFKVYPNPTHDHLSLMISELPVKSLSVRLVSADGKLVRSEEIKPSQGIFSKTFSLSGIAAGMYYLEVSSSDYSSKVKVVVQ